MPIIQNINTLQSTVDFDKLSTLTNTYILEALANLGQRIGIKGDSVKYGFISPKEIMSTVNEDTSDYKYLKINYAKQSTTNNDDYVHNKIYASLKLSNSVVENDLNELDITKYFEDITDTVFNNISVTINFDDLDLLYHDINQISPQSRISVSNNEMKCCLFGQRLGVDVYNCDVSLYTYDIHNQYILNNKKLIYLYNENNVSYYAYLDLAKITDTAYSLYVKIFNTTDMINSLNDTEYATLMNFINNYLIYDNLENVNNTDVLDDINILFNSISRKINSNVYYNINVNYNSEADTDIDETIFSTPDFNNITVMTNNGYSIDNYLKYVSHDLIYIFPYIITEYSNKFIYANKATLVLRILFNLYEYILNSEDLLDSNYRATSLVVPLDYVFYYLYNEYNDMQIYNSSNIFVTYLNKDNDSLQINDNSIYFIYNSNIGIDVLTKTILYYFNVDYVKDNAISVKFNKLYTLPYIDIDNTWIINDVDTNIKAKYDSVSDSVIAFEAQVLETTDSENNTSYIVRKLADSLEDVDIKLTNEYLSSIEYYINTSYTGDVLNMSMQLPIFEVNQFVDSLFIGKIYNNITNAEFTEYYAFYKCVIEDNKYKIVPVSYNKNDKNYVMGMCSPLNIDNIIKLISTNIYNIVSIKRLTIGTLDPLNNYKLYVNENDSLNTLVIRGDDGKKLIGTTDLYESYSNEDKLENNESSTVIPNNEQYILKSSTENNNTNISTMLLVNNPTYVTSDDSEVLQREKSIPNNAPIVDNGYVLNDNETILNKVNISTFRTSSSNMYNAYLGFDEYKSTPEFVITNKANTSLHTEAFDTNITQKPINNIRIKYNNILLDGNVYMENIVYDKLGYDNNKNTDIYTKVTNIIGSGDIYTISNTSSWPNNSTGGTEYNTNNFNINLGEYLLYKMHENKVYIDLIMYIKMYYNPNVELNDIFINNLPLSEYYIWWYDTKLTFTSTRPGTAPNINDVESGLKWFLPSLPNNIDSVLQTPIKINEFNNTNYTFLLYIGKTFSNNIIPAFVSKYQMNIIKTVNENEEHQYFYINTDY